MPTKITAQWRLYTALLALFFVTGCAMLTGIPDLDTPDGRVYAQRCGACHGISHVAGHGIPDPRLRTKAEWERVLPKMERLIQERALPPLTESERDALTRYLSQYAKP